MIEEWLYIAKKYTIAGARTRFEDICASLFKKKVGDRVVKTVRVTSGDGGIDIFIGDLGISPIHVFQCKFFLQGIEASQKQQISESFRTVIEAAAYECSGWTLCVPEEFSLSEHLWWSKWKEKQAIKYGLQNDYIQLIDGADLIDELKEYNLYNDVFDEDVRVRIDRIIKYLGPIEFDLDSELNRGSLFFSGLKNYFSDKKECHLDRIQVNNIVDWTATELKGKDRLERILVVKGKKGVGKSTVLRDVYFALKQNPKYCLLAIKCDQLYDVNLESLAKQLFGRDITFNDIFHKANVTGKNIIVFLDQLDALSQTLSADRRWLNTYITLIEHLLEYNNVRIILSTRSFDLEYDADLRKFNNQNVRHIEVDNLSTNEVITALNILDLTVSNKILLELLRVPYNLELFTKIPELGNLLKSVNDVSLSHLHAELSLQILQERNLNVKGCLDLIVRRMYSGQPNLIEQRYLENFGLEMSYLISHGILIKYGSKLSFFHQSFYEYYLAGWFVDSEKDLVHFIFEEEQNLYIRSLIKTVIEFLREADHAKYIQLYKDIISNEEIRYHIRYLIIAELGQIDEPSENEKKMIYGLLGSAEGEMFLDIFCSSGWILFFIENKLLPQDENRLYGIFLRNLNFYPQTILGYLTRSNFEGKEVLITSLIPSIRLWTDELLLYFDRYYLYGEDNELWYFETLKKIASVDMTFVLDKLGPIILSHKKYNKRIKFDYRYDRIIDELFKSKPKIVIAFLLKIHVDILESTQCKYFGFYDGIFSPLVSSAQYQDGFRQQDGKDEKSIESFLIIYYKDCDRRELEIFFHAHKQTNFVPLLTLLIKLLRDRAEEFKDEIFMLLVIIKSKNGLLGMDDFFSLNIRRLIAKTMLLFTKQQYVIIKGLIFSIKHPYEIFKYDLGGNKKYQLSIGKKKYLFLSALPPEVFKMDHELKTELQVLMRRYGNINHNQALDKNGIRWGGGKSALSNPNFDKFNHNAWLSSMRKITEDFVHDDFLRGGILEHGRSFEEAVTKTPSYFYSFIASLFDEKGISMSYISHGISGLIKANDDIKKTAALIEKEIQLTTTRTYIKYAVWHSRFLIDHQMVSDYVVEFWIKVANWEPNENDHLNEANPMTDFINSPRGAAIDNLMRLGDYPNYKENVFETIEHIVEKGMLLAKPLACGIVNGVHYLNHLNIERAFSIFKSLVLLGDPLILKQSINAGQYYNSCFHNRMGFYFQEMLRHEELYDQCYFFISSWLFESINDYAIYDKFMKLGNNAMKCAMTVAEEFLVKDKVINQKCLLILQRCLAQNETDLSHEFSGVVLRKFGVEHFMELYGFIEKYMVTEHFANDPRYLFQYLTECATVYPRECLALLCKINLPFAVDMRKRAYVGDEPLILVLAIYSKLRSVKFMYKKEQERALDEFDRMLTMPSIRMKAIDALVNVLN